MKFLKALIKVFLLLGISFFVAFIILVDAKD